MKETFNIITLNLWTFMVWFLYMLLLTSGERLKVNSTLRNIFTEKNGDMFSTYAVHSLVVATYHRPKYEMTNNLSLSCNFDTAY